MASPSAKVDVGNVLNPSNKPLTIISLGDVIESLKSNLSVDKVTNEFLNLKPELHPENIGILTTWIICSNLPLKVVGGM